jgi:hypothetical protein
VGGHAAKERSGWSVTVCVLLGLGRARASKKKPLMAGAASDGGMAAGKVAATFVNKLYKYVCIPPEAPGRLCA